MKLCDFISQSDILYSDLDPETPISGVSADSRVVRSGELFICIRGGRLDGHDYAQSAVAAGAEAIVCDHRIDSVPCVVVKDTRKVWAEAENAAAGYPSRRMKFIAVTGTNGKTTVTYLLRSILEKSGVSCGILGTVNAEMTTPDPDMLYPLLADMADAGCEYVVMEASSHSLVQKRLAPLRFEAGIFLGLTPEHLDFHRDMEDYYAAKRSLFDRCLRGAVNLDDSYGRRLVREVGCACRGFGMASCDDEDDDFYASDLIFGGGSVSADAPFGGLSYRMRSRDTDMEIKSPMPWRHNVCNTLAAASAARMIGVGEDCCAAGIADVRCIPGRLEHIPMGAGGPLLFIDYAHTPDALRSSLMSLRDRMDGSEKYRRLSVLFGCGGDRDKTKRPVMGKIASRLADYTVITSDNSRSEEPEQIIREIVKGFDRERAYSVIPDRREAILSLLRQSGEGDVILLAGKGHEDYEIDRSGKHPFSEKKLVEDFRDGKIK